jgi:hypothetical protein
MVGMRFSLRWLLVGVAFIAVAAAAIGTNNRLLADLTWAAVMMAICYAAVVACTSKGMPKAIAVGFLVLAIANLVAMHLTPSKVPSMRLFAALGYTVTEDGYVWTAPAGFAPSTRATPDAAFHAINAVGVLVAGLVGAVIGWFAGRHAKE